jgi:predicted secreted protein
VNWYTGIMTYIIIWWCVLFAVLPIGVRTPEEAGVEATPGQVPSAPVRPRLVFKALLTTAIASLLFAVFWYMQDRDLLGLGAFWKGQ